MKLKLHKLHPDAKTPTYGSEGAAAFDLYAVDGGYMTNGDALTLSTGLCVEVPPGQVLLVFSRSGHGFHHGVRLANSVGVIDSDYRGTVQVRLHCDGPHWTVEPGDRVAQGLLLPIERVEFVDHEELTETKRGKRGLGSTGK